MFKGISIPIRNCHAKTVVSYGELIVLKLKLTMRLILIKLIVSVRVLFREPNMLLIPK